MLTPPADKHSTHNTLVFMQEIQSVKNITAVKNARLLAQSKYFDRVQRKAV